MKVKELIRHLNKYDTEKEILLYDVSGVFDMVMLAIDDDDDNVILNIKNYDKTDTEVLH